MSPGRPLRGNNRGKIKEGYEQAWTWEQDAREIRQSSGSRRGSVEQLD